VISPQSPYSGSGQVLVGADAGRCQASTYPVEGCSHPRETVRPNQREGRLAYTRGPMCRLDLGADEYLTARIGEMYGSSPRRPRHSQALIAGWLAPPSFATLEEPRWLGTITRSL
jgi:hypothetical protein